MASIAPQSIEEYENRIVYDFPAASFTQATSSMGAIFTPGYKTLVNDAVTTSFAFPAQGSPAKYFKIDWEFVPMISMLNNIFAVQFKATVDADKIRATTLNYDGKGLQTVFYGKKKSCIYAGSQLRAINITDIELSPMMPGTDYSVYGIPVTVNVYAATCSLLLLAHPVVTMFRR